MEEERGTISEFGERICYDKIRLYKKWRVSKQSKPIGEKIHGRVLCLFVSFCSFQSICHVLNVCIGLSVSFRSIKTLPVLVCAKSKWNIEFDWCYRSDSGTYTFYFIFRYQRVCMNYS